MEVPNERTRVGYLLDNSKECPDKDVTAAIAVIRLDNSAGGMRNKFERAVAFLLPTEPVKKGRKRDASTISAVGAGATLATGKHGQGKGGKRTSFKVSKGKTGVELWFHK